MQIGVGGHVQQGEQLLQPAPGGGCYTRCAFRGLLAVTAQQPVEFFRDPFTVLVQSGQ